MDILKGLLFINNVDVFEEYGAFLTEDTPDAYTNYSELLTPPKMKPYTAIDYREEDGEKLPEVLPTPAYEPRDVQLYFAIQAETAAQFLARYMAFIRMLKAGWLMIRVPELGMTYKMYYKTAGKYEQITHFEDYVAARFKVVLREPIPAF